MGLLPDIGSGRERGATFRDFLSQIQIAFFQKYIQLSEDLQIICLVNEYSTSSVSLELLQALFAALLALNICGIQPFTINKMATLQASFLRSSKHVKLCNNSEETEEV